MKQRVTLYVGNLPFKTNESDIRSLFSRYAPIHHIKIVHNHMTGFSRGFCFVTLDADMAERAAAMLNNFMLGNRNIKIMQAHGAQTLSNRPPVNGNSNKYPTQNNYGRPAW